ncbi:Spc98 family-domain-containing protein [Pseudomassariella vexata]|uniref:Spindle pole body component n=1 Tax=Pseudomassariella vexata TaxID=1141098 RepID=A0A1Y2EJJ8_9PEZI|nr:Spc98 family-domain-containing protein [Pseudomassariella vexata]ORY71667.1 Spc98 family-domain-containing protein [Pseudomassariella vexata]
MAFAARLTELTEELITVITSSSSQSDVERLNVLRESSLRKLRYNNFLRTNQFNVDDHLNGLEEHFRVLNRDELADALRENLDALSLISTKFTPEMLHFLLELSDQPVKKSKLFDLELLRQPKEDPGAKLTWDEIAQEDGWATDRQLWQKVDFTNDSSDDDYADEDFEGSVKSESTTQSSLEAQHRPRPTDYVIDVRDEDVLKELDDSQSWRTTPHRTSAGKPHRVIISEIQAVREVLFMLNGLPNDLFGPRGEPLTRFQLKHASWETCRALLGSFGEYGRQIQILRDFTSKPQKIPLMQVFADVVQKRLRYFDQKTSAIQCLLVDIKADTVISLVKLLQEVQPHVTPLLSLSNIIQQLDREKYPHPFRYLELLFESAGIAQLENNNSIYEFLGTIFFECFQIYLRPIRRWMEEGDLLEGDKTFFITKAKVQVPMSQVWQDQYRLRRTPDGALHVPGFLQPASNRIFTTGKSVIILKLLGRHETRQEQMPEPNLDFAGLGASEFGHFAPFSEIFNVAFESWMESKHHAASVTLRHALFDSCGMWSVLDALHHVYLMADGSRADALAFGIFNNIDLLNPKWHDRFTLTGQAHEAFATIVDSHRLSVSGSGHHAQEDIVVARRSVRHCLPAITIAYRMAWPVRIILSDDSIAQYQAVFTLLLQLRRATYVLKQQRLVSQAMSDSCPEQAIYFGLRSKLLWFTSSLQFYLLNIVIGPLTSKLREDLGRAEDVDAMIAVHATFSKRMLDEACLNSRLNAIHQCILDILDLAIRLEDTRKFEAERDAEETQELSRLSVMRSPMDSGKSHGERFLKVSEEEDESFLSEQDHSAVTADADRTYLEVLREIRRDFDKHLRFISGGLKGVARASGDAAARKWDTLAEMFEVGAPHQLW